MHLKLGGRVAEGHETRAAARKAKAAAEPHRVSPGVDRFDAVERRARVGVHRVIGRPRRFWLYLVSALVGIVLLTGGGILALQMTGANLHNMGGSDTQAETTKKPVAVKAELDPTAPVVVLNGTGMGGFESIVDGAITQNGWGQILFSAPAAANDVQISAVFYSAPEDEAAALGLAKELGGVSTFQSSEYDEYGARLIVLLGADYAGPGSDQLVLPEAVTQ